MYRFATLTSFQVKNSGSSILQLRNREMAKIQTALKVWYDFRLLKNTWKARFTFLLTDKFFDISLKDLFRISKKITYNLWEFCTINNFNCQSGSSLFHADYCFTKLSERYLNLPKSQLHSFSFDWWHFAFLFIPVFH